MTAPSYQEAKAGYTNLWSEMTIRPEHQTAIDAAAHIVLEAMESAFYDEIAAKTGVPTVFIGLLHHMESNCNFQCHLHNGDSLSAKTHNVPSGRPLIGAAPFSFVDSAIDALTMQGFVHITDWCIERLLFSSEAMNGWGYIARGVNSPYLWSFSSLYTAGKYVSDGVYDPNAVSEQIGVAVLLKRIMQLDPSVTVGAPDKSVVKAVKDSPSLQMLLHAGAAIIAVITGGLDAAVNGIDNLIGAAPTVQSNVDQFMGPAQSVAKSAGFPTDTVALGVVLICILAVLFRQTPNKMANK